MTVEKAIMFLNKRKKDEHYSWVKEQYDEIIELLLEQEAVIDSYKYGNV